jgi:hypothetical protein
MNSSTIVNGPTTAVTRRRYSIRLRLGVNENAGQQAPGRPASRCCRLPPRRSCYATAAREPDESGGWSIRGVKRARRGGFASAAQREILCRDAIRE